MSRSKKSSTTASSSSSGREKGPREPRDVARLLANLNMGDDARFKEPALNELKRQRPKIWDELLAHTAPCTMLMATTTPISCLFRYANNGGVESVTQLTQDAGLNLCYSDITKPDEWEAKAKDLEKGLSAAERLYRLFEDDTIGCSLSKLSKAHVANVFLKDDERRHCYTLHSAEGRAITGPIIVTLTEKNRQSNNALMPQKLLDIRRNVVALFSAKKSHHVEAAEKETMDVDKKSKSREKPKKSEKSSKSKKSSERKDKASRSDKKRKKHKHSSGDGGSSKKRVLEISHVEIDDGSESSSGDKESDERSSSATGETNDSSRSDDDSIHSSEESSSNESHSTSSSGSSKHEKSKKKTKKTKKPLVKESKKQAPLSEKKPKKASPPVSVEAPTSMEIEAPRPVVPVAPVILNDVVEEKKAKKQAKAIPLKPMSESDRKSSESNAAKIQEDSKALNDWFLSINEAY